MERLKPGRLRWVCVVWVWTDVGWMAMLLWFAMLSGGHAQAPRPAKLEFDVASVRQNKSSNDEARTNFPLDNGNIYRTPKAGDDAQSSAGYFSATNQPMWCYISFAYKLNGAQELALRFSMFSGLSSKAPKWVTGGFDAGADRFDILARTAGHPTKDDVRLMMRSLLADRFQMAAHFETREAPVLAMVLAKPGKLGPALKVHPANDSCTEGADTTSAKNAEALEAKPEVCGMLGRLPPSAPGMVRISGRGISLALLANSLPTQTGMAIIGRPVIDRTGLSGLYDVTLEWAGLLNGQPNPEGSTFEEALRDELGLKLQSDKGPVQILVIDHIEHPSEN
jgi:uncharacterized protein (TIGR03435 family)